MITSQRMVDHILPTPPRGVLRRILEQLSDADRKAVFIDYFPALAGRLSSGMEGREQVNLLLSQHKDEAIWAALCKAAEHDSTLAACINRDTLGTPPTLPKRPIQVSLPIRNNVFTGRKQALTALHIALRQHRSVAVVGLGGIGKSSLVLEYTHQHAEEYPLLVYWLSVTNLGALGLGLLELGRRLRDSGLADGYVPPDQQPEAVQIYVLSWLRRHHDWLLVLDNADALETLRPLLPDSSRGYLLCTTRAPDPLALGMYPFELLEFSSEEAVEFLGRRCGAAANALDDGTAMRELSSELGHLPLALEQAGAYIAVHKTPVRNYLAAYRKRRAGLFSDGVSGRERESVTTVWSLSFEQVERESLTAADLLRVSAFLSPDFIPDALLYKACNNLGDTLTCTLDPENHLSVDKTLGPLLRHSLIRRSTSDSGGVGGYSIHRLIQDVIRLRLGSEEPSWAIRAVRALDNTFPNSEFSSWPTCQAMLPCVNRVLDHIERLELASPEVAWLLNQVARYLTTQANYARAESLFRRALSILEQMVSTEEPKIAAVLSNLAVVLIYRGELEEAEQFCRKALAIFEQMFSPDDPHTAQAQNNLVALLAGQERFEEAEQLCRRALATREQKLGCDHPDTSRSLNNLAALLNEQGKQVEAASLFRRVLETRECMLGLEHPDTATSLMNLAWVLYTQGKPEEAEPLYRRALAIREKVFGIEHHLTGRLRRHIAALFESYTPHC